MKQGWLIWILFWFVHRVHGQELPVNTTQQLENLAALTEEEPDETVLLQLNQWLRKPLNLNEARMEDLKSIPFLSALQVSHFFKYRQLAGHLVAVHELQAIPSWDLGTIRELLPYVTIANNEKILDRRSIFSGGDHMLQLRLGRTMQKAVGYQRQEGTRYAGDPNHLLLRYLYRKDQQTQLGIVAEKDAGELLLSPKHGVPDFSSAHFFRRGRGVVKALALGDYTVSMGQGLIHWQALAFGKSPEVLAIKRQGPVLRPYAAAGEFFYLRGAGITMGSGPWETTLFAATQRVHANRDVNEEGAEVISSFAPSGLHRTPSEYNLRRAVTQTAAGGSVQYRKGLFHTGVNGVLYRYPLAIEKRPEPYNFYAPQGALLYNLSMDYGYTHRNVHFFGEAALDYKSRPAVVQGALLSVHPSLDLSLLGRMVHRGFAALAANAFSEASNGTNEQGLFVGMQWRMAPKVRVSTYADVFRWPWLRFRVDAPAMGADYLLQVLLRPSKTSEAYLLLRSETKAANQARAHQPLPMLANRQRRSVRLQWSMSLSDKLQVRCRAEGVGMLWNGSVPARGFLFFGDIRYRLPRNATLDGRLAWFDTDNADTRIYAYEQDVLYGYSIPGLHGKGLRGYLNLRLPVYRDCTLWLRIAHSLYSDREEIGSGLATIQGNQRTDVRCQLIMRF